VQGGSALRITLDNPALVTDLTDFLRRCECKVEQVGSRALEVDVAAQAGQPVGAEHEWARLQIDAFLRVWQLLHPETQAHLFA